MASTSVSLTRDSTAPPLDLDAQRMAGDVDLALQAGEDLVEHGGQVALVLDPVDEDHELVAAEAADLDVSLAKAASRSATA